MHFASTLRSPTSALRHPLWWAALGALLLNDHVLKGAGILPGAITGKLSDFAGLLVAPVLLAAIVRARRRRTILACFAATGAVFAAIKVSPAAASASETVMAFMSWRVWSDPTDLIALPMLLVGWHVFVEPRPNAARDEAGGSPMLSRAALVLGGFACIATSQPAPEPWDPRSVPPQYGQLEILYDAPGATTTASEVVRVRQLRAGVSVDCARLLAAPFDVVTSSLLAPANRFALAPNALVDSASGVSAGSSQCRLAVIDHETAGTITIAYSTSAPGSRVSLVRNADGVLAWSLSSGTLVRGAPSSPPTSEACGAASAGLPVTWTPVTGTYFQWKGAITEPDGCTLVKLGHNLAGLDDERWFLCGVDARTLPFLLDETVQVSSSTAGFEIRSVDGRASAMFSHDAGTDMRFEAVPGCIVSDACGERSVPQSPRMNEAEWSVLPDASGAIAAFEHGSFGATSRERRYVLRATHWLSADSACVDGAATSGMDLELLTVTESTR